MSNKPIMDKKDKQYVLSGLYGKKSGTADFRLLKMKVRFFVLFKTEQSKTNKKWRISVNNLIHTPPEAYNCFSSTKGITIIHK